MIKQEPLGASSGESTRLRSQRGKEGLSAGTCACVQTSFSDFLSNICALLSWVSVVPLFNKQFGRHMPLSKGEKNSPDFYFFFIAVNMQFYYVFPRVFCGYPLHHLAGLIHDFSVGFIGGSNVKEANT